MSIAHSIALVREVAERLPSYRPRVVARGTSHRHFTNSDSLWNIHTAKCGGLGEQADDLVDTLGVACGVQTVYDDPAVSRGDHPGQHTDGGGLASAVGPKEAQHFPRPLSGSHRQRQPSCRSFETGRMFRLLTWVSFECTVLLGGEREKACPFVQRRRVRFVTIGPGHKGHAPGDVQVPPSVRSTRCQPFSRSKTLRKVSR